MRKIALNNGENLRKGNWALSENNTLWDFIKISKVKRWIKFIFNGIGKNIKLINNLNALTLSISDVL